MHWVVGTLMLETLRQGRFSTPLFPQIAAVTLLGVLYTLLVAYIGTLYHYTHRTLYIGGESFVQYLCHAWQITKMWMSHHLFQVAWKLGGSMPEGMLSRRV